MRVAKVRGLFFLRYLRYLCGEKLLPPTAHSVTRRNGPAARCRPGDETKARCRRCQSICPPVGACRPAHIVSTSGIGSGPYKEVFTAAARPGWWIIAGCGLAVLVLGAVTTGGWARRTAERTAERLELEDGGSGSGAGEGEGGGGEKGVRGSAGARTAM